MANLTDYLKALPAEILRGLVAQLSRYQLRGMKDVPPDWLGEQELKVGGYKIPPYNGGQPNGVAREGMLLDMLRTARELLVQYGLQPPPALPAHFPSIHSYPFPLDVTTLPRRHNYLRNYALPLLKRNPAGFNSWRTRHGYVPLVLLKANLRGAVLRNVDWAACVLAFADLEGADLRGGKFAHAVLHLTNVAGAQIDPGMFAGHDYNDLIGLKVKPYVNGADYPDNRWFRPASNP